MHVQLKHQDEDGVIHKVDDYYIPEDLGQDLVKWLVWAEKTRTKGKQK